MLDFVAQRPELNWRMAAYAVFAIAFVWLSTLSYNTSGKFPHSQDEVNYVFQARLFASGQIKENMGELNPYLPNHWSVMQDGKRFSKYPPLGSLVLVPSVWLNIPWIMMPLFGALSLWLLWRIALTLVGEKLALLATLVCASSPWFSGYAISYYTQAFVLALVLGTSWFLFYQPQRVWMPTLLIFVMALTRPLDACIVGATTIIYLTLFERRQGILYIAGGTVLGLLCLMSYNYLVADKLALILKGYQGYIPGAKEPSLAGGLAALQKFLTTYFHQLTGPTWHVLHTWIFRYAGYAMPILAFIGLFNRTIPAKIRVLPGTLFVLYTLGYGVHPTIGWPSFGARYHYPTIALLCLLATFGLKGIWDLSKSRRFVKFGLILGLLIWQGTLAYARQTEYLARYAAGELLFRKIAEQCPDKPVAYYSKRSEYRNFGSFLQTAVIYRNMFRDGRHPDNRALRDEPFYIVNTWEHARSVGEIVNGKICTVKLVPFAEVEDAISPALSSLLYTSIDARTPYVNPY